ncbi:MAG TPA: hypothetical protein VGL56_07115 [Fimbriimonadaceae bacterium]|jgi:hypothetical protein
MMMFRRLYWVAEQVDKTGRSKVTGVYTSIQDLIYKGLNWCDENSGSAGYRLTLVKPDSFNCPLGVWVSPNFAGLANTLENLVTSGEYNRDEVISLTTALQDFAAEHAKAS